jgi:hypothetical protein
MQRLRVLGPENATALEMMATHHAHGKLAEAHVAEHGPIVPAPHANRRRPTKTRRERFIETAREMGASEYPEDFERSFRQIVKQPVTPKPSS